MKTFKKPIILLFIAFILVTTITQSIKKDTISPSELNRENNTKVYVPEREILQTKEVVPMSVDIYELQILGPVTETGNPTDILQTIKGQGFYYTSRPPRLLFGKDFIVENTEVNKEGTELYVILSKEILEKLQYIEFREAIIFMGDDPESKSAVRFEISPSNYFEIDTNKTVDLKYKRGYFIRE